MGWKSFLSKLCGGSKVHKKSSQFISEALKGHEIERLPLDGTYYLANKDQMKKWIEEDMVDVREYKRNKYDCENFAFSFKAHMDFEHEVNQVGLVIDYESGHSYNVIVWANGKFSLFEPQNDKLFPYSRRNEEMYHFDGSTVLI